MTDFNFTKGDHISTNILWERPSIEKFKKFLNKEFLPNFPQNTHEAYLYGSFPWEITWDIDIAIIGKPTDEVAQFIINMYNISLNEYRQLIDVAIFESADLFIGIEQFNRTNDASVLGQIDMYKPYYESYYNKETIYNKERHVEKISKFLYKHFISEETIDEKFYKADKIMRLPTALNKFSKVFSVR